MIHHLLNSFISQLFPFLAACQNDAEKACQLIAGHYRIRNDSQEFYQNRDIASMEVQSSLANQEFVILPTTPDNCNLILFRLKSFEPSDYDFDNTAKTYILTTGKNLKFITKSSKKNKSALILEAAIFKNGPRNGLICLVDMRGSRFGHLFRPSISSIRKGLRLLQEGCPFDIKAIHVFNTFQFVNAIVCKW